jgi:hypothetical protein
MRPSSSDSPSRMSPTSHLLLPFSATDASRCRCSCRIGSPAAAALLTKLAGIYSPELVVGTTAACCSDHQSSNAFGFPSTQMFERNGGIIDPMYHNTGDVSRRAGYDLDQVKSISKVTLAGLLEVAEYVQ